MNPRDIKVVWIVFIAMAVMILIQLFVIQYGFHEQHDQIAHNHIGGIQIHLLNCRIGASLGVDLKGTGCGIQP